MHPSESFSSAEGRFELTRLGYDDPYELVVQAPGYLALIRGFSFPEPDLPEPKDISTAWPKDLDHEEVFSMFRNTSPDKKAIDADAASVAR